VKPEFSCVLQEKHKTKTKQAEQESQRLYKKARDMGTCPCSPTRSKAESGYLCGYWRVLKSKFPKVLCRVSSSCYENCDEYFTLSYHNTDPNYTPPPPATTTTTQVHSTLSVPNNSIVTSRAYAQRERRIWIGDDGNHPDVHGRRRKPGQWCNWRFWRISAGCPRVLFGMVSW